MAPRDGSLHRPERLVCASARTRYGRRHRRTIMYTRITVRRWCGGEPADDGDHLASVLSVRVRFARVPNCLHDCCCTAVFRRAVLLPRVFIIIIIITVVFPLRQLLYCWSGIHEQNDNYNI